MMGMVEIARRIESFQPDERQRFLDLMIQRGFSKDGDEREVIMDFNAKLFTTLRREGLWPPQKTEAT